MICALVVWKGLAKFCSDVSESVSMSICVLVVRVFFAIVSAFWIASSSAVSIECLLSNLYVCVNVGVIFLQF